MKRFACRVLAALLPLFGVLQSALANENVTYAYDALGRLVAVSSSGSVNNGQSVATTFDPAGNRTNYSVNGVPVANALLSIAGTSVTEGGTLVFTVTRTGDTTGTSSASYTTADDTAVAPGDYTAGTGTVSFAAGQTTATISVATIDDTLVEAAESMTVTLSAPSANTTIVTATRYGTINDNDAAPSYLAIAPASVTEGGILVFTVTRTGNTTGTSSASYTTADYTAFAPGDYTAGSGTVSFAAGQTTATISVTTIDDTVVESPESMSVTLSGASANTTIVTATRYGTINDNDAP